MILVVFKYYPQKQWHTLTNPEEAVEVFYKTDIILDMMWFMFSHSIGRCYHGFINDGSNWASKYFVNLARDFFIPFQGRW